MLSSRRKENLVDVLSNSHRRKRQHCSPSIWKRILRWVGQAPSTNPTLDQPNVKDDEDINPNRTLTSIPRDIVSFGASRSQTNSTGSKIYMSATDSLLDSAIYRRCIRQYGQIKYHIGHIDDPIPENIARQ